jgi:hypothetical protein
MEFCKLISQHKKSQLSFNQLVVDYWQQIDNRIGSNRINWLENQVANSQLKLSNVLGII